MNNSLYVSFDLATASNVKYDLTQCNYIVIASGSMFQNLDSNTFTPLQHSKTPQFSQTCQTFIRTTPTTTTSTSTSTSSSSSLPPPPTTTTSTTTTTTIANASSIDRKENFEAEKNKLYLKLKIKSEFKQAFNDTNSTDFKQFKLDFNREVNKINFNFV